MWKHLYNIILQKQITFLQNIKASSSPWSPGKKKVFPTTYNIKSETHLEL